MKCPPKEELARYLDGELPKKSRSAIRAHLLSCPECRVRLKSLGKTNSLLRSYLPSPLSAGPDCPDEETILAYAEGGLNDRDEERITAHLVGCDYCALEAAGALETIRLREELVKKGLEPLPPSLTRRVRERLRGRKPVSLGRVVAVLSDLRERIQRSFEYRLPAPAYSVVMEPSVPYETTPPHAEDARPAAKEAPPLPGRVTVEIGPSGSGQADLRVSLSDEPGRPLAGISLQLQRERKLLATRRTGSRGEANFPNIGAGVYRLLIRRRQEVSLDIIIN